MYKKYKKTPSGFWRKNKYDENGNVARVTFSPIKKVRDIHKKFLGTHENVSIPEVYDCIEPHLGNTFYVKMDIADAFGSLSVEYTKKVLGALANWKGKEEYFFHEEGGIIQGANSSPLIFHLFCGLTIDLELSEYCHARGVIYTRYVDDLIFSSNRPMPRSMRKVFRKILRKHGFEPNPKKDVVVSIWKNRLRVLGAMISTQGVHVETSFYNRYLDYLTMLRDGDTSVKNIVSGMRAWMKYVHRLHKLQRHI